MLKKSRRKHLFRQRKKYKQVPLCTPQLNTGSDSRSPPETSQSPIETSPPPSETILEPNIQSLTSDSLEQWTTTSVLQGWVNQTETRDSVVRYCKLQNMPIGFGNQPVRVHICLLVILPGGFWQVYSQDKRIDPNITLPDWPATITPDTLYECLSSLDNLTTCIGNADQQLMEIAVKRKGIFKAAEGKEVKARVDSIPFVSDGKPYPATIRTSECQMLVKRRCSACKTYRRTLLTMARQTGKKQHDVTSTSSHTNWRFLSTPQKTERVSKRAREVKSLRASNEILREIKSTNVLMPWW